MEQTVLSEPQRKVIEAVTNESKLENFYLTGGTALSAYYLQHRVSDDLDFFALADIDIVFIHAFVEKLKKNIGSDGLRFARLYDRNQFFFKLGDGELKVEFAEYPFNRLDDLLISDGARIDSFRDIAANKLMAILDRFDPKDFVDIFFILKQAPLNSTREDAEKKFNVKVDDIFLGGELTKARRIEALPKMTKPLTIEELRVFFAKTAKELGNKILE